MRLRLTALPRARGVVKPKRAWAGWVAAWLGSPVVSTVASEVAFSCGWLKAAKRGQEYFWPLS